MEIKWLSINEIRVGYHPRKGFNGKVELKEQIQKNGPNPVRVRPENDFFIVIDGNRTLSVLKELRYETVPCIIVEIDERTAAHQSYVLNTEDCRQNLTPIEVSLHIKEMRERFGYSVRDLVNLGYAKDDQTIYNKLNLLSLPQEIQDKILDGEISPTAGYKLAAVRDLELQSRAFQMLVKVKNRSVRKTAKTIKNLSDSVNSDKDKKEFPVPAPEGDVPGVFFHDSNDMREFKDGTIPLIVVSPNYGVGMEFEEGVSFEEHKADLERCLPEWGRKLMPGGYLCMNFGDIHNFGSKNETEPEIQLTGYIFQDLLRPLNIRLRDIKIWEKGMTFVNNQQVSFHEDTEHTSYRSLHNFEYIFIFKKDGKREVPYDLDIKSRISEEEWKEWVGGIWRIEPVKKQKNHPAQFPEELPKRFITMFSYEGDVVVDTALGSGTTIKVARELNRKGYGYERDFRYKPVIMRKLGINEQHLKEKDKKNPTDSTKGEKSRGVRQVIEELLPQIAAESKGRGEHIRKISFMRKPGLRKEDIIVDTVPFADCFTGSASAPPPLPNKPDDYEKELADFRPTASALAEVA